VGRGKRGISSRSPADGQQRMTRSDTRAEQRDQGGKNSNPGRCRGSCFSMTMAAAGGRHGRFEATNSSRSIIPGLCVQGPHSVYWSFPSSRAEPISSVEGRSRWPHGFVPFHVLENDVVCWASRIWRVAARARCSDVVRCTVPSVFVLEWRRHVVISWALATARSFASLLEIALCVR